MYDFTTFCFRSQGSSTRPQRNIGGVGSEPMFLQYRSRSSCALPLRFYHSVISEETGSNKHVSDTNSETITSGHCCPIFLQGVFILLLDLRNTNAKV
ncbi:hypothetical protein AVEN_163548-1 [Araneus ventricosus]|uniref:Uncharacterized protein n=1 Tax=Araneus ventricosus TaxID=182803 RepID=A0A4Y2RJS8_ARAVE|nr:hypothetical protein AVEN_163548-1 [Araneus ventricosus]